VSLGGIHIIIYKMNNKKERESHGLTRRHSGHMANAARRPHQTNSKNQSTNDPRIPCKINNKKVVHKTAVELAGRCGHVASAARRPVSIGRVKPILYIIACFMNTVTLNMYISTSYTGMTRRTA